MITNATPIIFNPNFYASNARVAKRGHGFQKESKFPVLNINKTCAADNKVLKQIQTQINAGHLFNQKPINRDRVEFNISDKLDFSKISNGFDLQGLSYEQVAGVLATFKDTHYVVDVSGFLENASALRDALETRINSGLTDDKQAQLTNLNAIFDKAIDVFANEYIKTVGHFVRAVGAEIPENEIRESIYAIFGQKNGAPFTANDLTALYLATINPINNIDGLKGDTSAIGLSLSLNYLSAMEIMDKYGISDKMREIINNFVDGFTENYAGCAERMEEDKLIILSKIGKSSLYTYNPNIYNDIMKAVNLTKELYASDKSMIEILQKVCALSYEQNKSNPSDFWKNFYDNGSGKSVMGSLLERWDNFSKALDSGNSKGVIDAMCGVNNVFKFR